MNNHTPGKWELFTDGEGRLCIVIKAGDSIESWIARIYDDDKEVALKIIATPDLLVMCKVAEEAIHAMLDPEHCAHNHIDWSDIRKRIQRAIEKASKQP